MFKILAVVCTLGGDCSSFISEDQATHATLRDCEQKAEVLAVEMFDLLKDDRGFGIMKVGCVTADFTLELD